MFCEDVLTNERPVHEGFLPIVAVPARNEERRLAALLAGLAAQTWGRTNTRPLPVVLVLNNCMDGSGDVAMACDARHPGLDVHIVEVVFEEPDAHAGSARRLAMETAFGLCPFPPGSVILTTDADAVPRTNWIAQNLRHLGDGVDLIGGLIVGNADEEKRLGPDFNTRARLHQRYGQMVDRLSSLIDPLAHDPWPHHHDHTGASLAVRADVYRAVGGMPALPFREDVAFVERVIRGGFLVRHPLDVVVDVSARLAGRAPGGMADCLQTWVREAAAGAPLLVEDPARLHDRLQERRRRRAHAAPVEDPAGRSPGEIFGLDASRTMEVEDAMDLIGTMIEQMESGSRAA